MNILVLGATGGIGREVVAQAVAHGDRVTVLARAPEKLAAKLAALAAKVTVLEGSPLEIEALRSAVDGQDAVVSSLGAPGLGSTTVHRDGARVLVAATARTALRRVLVVSAGMLFPDSGFLGAVLRTTLLRAVAEDSRAMESTLRASELEWTIVRPPRLTNGPRTERYAIARDRLPVGGRGSIPRADVAHFLVDECHRGRHIGEVVGIAAS